MLWIAAPLTGLIVQPIVGYLSDRTWTRLGRRRPYFLVGAVLATLALFAMPNSPTLWIAAGLLWMLDASINISMEPFRAFVGDQLPPSQRASGYAMQSFFIGVGSVVASLLPWLLAQGRRRATPPARARSRDTVRYAFYVGGAVLLARGRLDRAAHARISAGAARRPSTTRRRAPQRALDRRAARAATASLWLVVGAALAPSRSATFGSPSSCTCSPACSPATAWRCCCWR